MKIDGVVATFSYIYFPFIAESLNDNDETFFRSTLHNPQHVLCQLLPPPKQTGYNFRSRGHGLSLPEIQFEYLRKALFIACCTETFINTVVALRSLRLAVLCDVVSKI